MTLRSDPTRAGFTLLEALVVLAIISTVSAVVLSTVAGPSPRLTLQRDASTWMRLAASEQRRAIDGGAAPIAMDLRGLACEENKAEILFFRDGTASGPDLCLRNGEHVMRLAVDPLTGRMGSVTP